MSIDDEILDIHQLYLDASLNSKDFSPDLMLTSISIKRVMPFFLFPALRWVSLTYCISTSHLYDVLHSYEKNSLIIMSKLHPQVDVPYFEDLDSNSVNEDFYYGRFEEEKKSYKRLCNIIRQLTIEEDTLTATDATKKKKKPLFVSTIFSEEIPALMVKEYNAFAKPFDLITFPEYYKNALRNRHDAFREGDCSTKSAEDKNTRKSKEPSPQFAFSEAVTLACLYISHRKHAPLKLNRPLAADNQRTDARARFQNLKKHATSKKFYNVIARLLILLLKEWCQNQFDSMELDYIRDHLLPSKFAFTKDLRYAINTYVDNPNKNISINASERSCIQEASFHSHGTFLNYASYFSDCICSLAELILTEAIPDDILIHSESDTIDLCSYIQKASSLTNDEKNFLINANQIKISGADYLVALHASNIIDFYIAKASDSVIHLLSCLADANTLGEESFPEIFNNL